jgi:4-hydroxy-tetrahydrodipicolinate synthase
MFRGSLVALVTPMLPDGALDTERLAALVEFHARNGTDGIIAVGTTGESPTLDTEEHCRVIRLVVEAARGRMPVIAGTGANATSEAIELTRCGREAGADACLLVTPYYNKPTQEGLYRHFRAVAEAVDIPQILYNVPGRTAVDLLPATIARLAAVPHIVGVKEATGKVERVKEILDLTGGDFAVYSGDDATAREAILAGALGDISVTANVAPRLMHDMCALALAGDREGAARVDERLAPLHRSLFLESNPIPVKWALYEMGLIAEGIRLPLTPLSESLRPAVRQALVHAGVL